MHLLQSTNGLTQQQTDVHTAREATVKLLHIQSKLLQLSAGIVTQLLLLSIGMKMVKKRDVRKDENDCGNKK